MLVEVLILFLALCSVNLNTNVFGKEFSFCDPDLCGGKRNAHIACNNYREFARSCPRDASILDVSPFKRFFVQAHNSRRNFVALGLLPGFEPAKRMATMVWDDELAYLAELNLRKCHLSHDQCIHTYRFRNSGQCLAAFGIQKGKRIHLVNDIIEPTLSGWFRESNYIDSSYVDKPPLYRSDLKRWGHFLEIVVDRNTHVGCAVMTFTDPKYKDFYIIRMACNYAALYDGSSPIYEKGETASSCAFGSNPDYPGLCSLHEYFDINYDEVYGPRYDSLR